MSDDTGEQTPAVLETESGLELPLTDISRPDVVETRLGQFGIHGSPDVSGYGGLVNVVALPGASPRPYGGYFDEVADELAAALGPLTTWKQLLIEVSVQGICSSGCLVVSTL